MVSKLMFRLLPIQILLAAVGPVNGFVSSFFANNFVGIDTMSAVGLYGTINTLILALSTMLMAGSAILCGKYLGQNAKEKLQNVFSVNLLAAGLIGLLFVLLFVLFASFDLTGFMTNDPAVRPLFNQYLLGQSIGVIPLMIGVSIGEEDRQSLTDVMRVMFRKYVPLMAAVSALLIVFAVPLAEIYGQSLEPLEE